MTNNDYNENIALPVWFALTEFDCNLKDKNEWKIKSISWGYVVS